MSQEKYYNLIMAYGALTGISEPIKIIDGSPICINNITCSLVYNHGTHPDHLFIYADLGAFTKKPDQNAHLALLSANTKLYLDYGICLSLSPANGNAVFCFKLPLDKLTAEDLQERLKAATEAAVTWKETYLTEGETMDIYYPDMPKSVKAPAMQKIQYGLNNLVKKLSDNKSTARA